MRLLELLFLTGIGAAAAIAMNDTACSPVSTILVTVPASPATETIYALGKGSFATADPVNAAAQVTSTAVTTTVIASGISTQLINVIQASSPAEGQAAYSFAEDNGTTTWLGATPPASASLITSTQVVTLQPVPPGYVAAQEGATQVTNDSAVPHTAIITETRAETQTLVIATISTAYASARAYTGLASNGWNSSMSTFVTIRSAAIGSVMVGGISALPAPSGSVAVSRGHLTHLIKVRDVGDIVVATIDGAAVSWTNEYGGTSLSTPYTSPFVIPVTATALQPERESSPTSSTVSSLVQTGSSSPTGPTTTVGVHAWDSLPTPSLTSTSSSLVAQLTTSLTVSSLSLSSALEAPSTTPTANAPTCGDASAEFIIDFDDLPAFSAGPGDTDIPPIFNPYHNLFFQAYFGYVPPPSDPFPPISPPQLAVYRVGDSEVTNASNAGPELIGEIGSGPRASENAYWIDAYSAYLGCTNPGPDDCIIMVKGYQNWSIFSVISQGFTQPPCPGMKNCSLALVEFADGFRGLTGLQIIATVGNTRVDWYMDNLSLGWSNNTCAAQLERSLQM